MVFPSIEFAVFFPVVLAGSWALMGRPAWWKAFILVASYTFYAAASPKLCLLLAGITVGNQLVAELMHRAPSPAWRKRWLVAGVTLSLSCLAVFKYYGFFSSEINSTLDTFGLGLPIPLANIVLPIGISFYTFQAISYVADVYRGVLDKPAKLVDFAIVESFFPHLVAGPIVRARELLPQIEKPRNPHDVKVGAGVVFICIGLVKKVVIADYIAREVVDPVFAVPQAYGAADLILAAWGFTAQVYCDFSGYTDIAIGLALLLGVVFPKNFDRPYCSTSFRELWRRWHITLMRFFRDYVFIPLGGNRGGRLKTARNLMIVMTLGGLWHGAAWPFVLWGAINGAALAIESLLRGKVKAPPGWVGWLVVMNVFTFALIVFRNPSLSRGLDYLAGLADWSQGPELYSVGAVLAISSVIVLQIVPQKPFDKARAWASDLSPAPLALGMAATIFLVAATVPSGGVPPFIYFAF